MRYTSTLFVVVLTFLTFTGFGQNLTAGKALFKEKCASCHNKNMKDKLTGPALGGVQERWADYDEADLHTWIRNSQDMINSGHPKAVELWSVWKPTVMTAFPELTDEQIQDVLFYINEVYIGNYPKPVAGLAGDAVAVKTKTNYTPFIIGGVFILLLLALVLYRLSSNLDAMVKTKEGGAPVAAKSIGQLLTSRSVIGLVLFAAIILGGYTTVDKAIALGRQQGYQPEQPIKFSHAVHAGAQKIDCQYCHDGARRSKHSIIPATNTCMNCHSAVKKGTSTGTAEISKIYASIGWNPNTSTYVEGYENWPVDSIEVLYKGFIRESNSEDFEGRLDRLDELVEDEWDGIVNSLTGEEDPNIYGPVEWVRIHALPDHVYFNHAQHVSVGKVECQHCHGKVEEMETLKQVAPLSMGWCVNCHRKTDVKFANNPYYESYESYHKDLKAGEIDKVTVEMIGGIECQKCHY